MFGLAPCLLWFVNIMRTSAYVGYLAIPGIGFAAGFSLSSGESWVKLELSEPFLTHLTFRPEWGSMVKLCFVVVVAAGILA